ncbi:MAG: hypothetical protein ACOCU0_03885, partial [Bacillota bacterium]
MKKFLIVAMFAFVLFLSACDMDLGVSDDDSETGSENDTEEVDADSPGPIELTDAMLYHNLEWMELDDYEQTMTASVDETLYDGDERVDRYYRDEGLLLIETAEGDQGVWTLAEGRFLIEPKENQSVYVSTNDYVGATIRITTASTDSEPSQLEMIDIAGNTILEKDAYASWDIDWERDTEEGIIIETIEYLTEDDDDAGEEPTEEAFVVDFDTGERTAYDENDRASDDDEPDSKYEKGDTFEETESNRTDLEPYGLDGHTLSQVGSSYKVYEGAEQVASFQGPSLRSSSTPSILMDGHFIYQSRDSLPESSEDYTFITQGGTKTLLKTYSVDMTTGERSVLNVDYLIESMEEFKDEDGVNRYAYSEIIPIEDELLEKYTSEVIIDANGSIRHDVSGMNLMEAFWLKEKPEDVEDIDDSYYLFDEDRQLILDTDLRVLYSTDSMEDASFTEEGALQGFFIRYEDHLGEIALDGTVTIPFVLDDIDGGFIEGSLLASHNEEPVLVNRDGDITPIEAFVLDVYNDAILT